MADSTNLNDIFKAMEEIDLLSEKRKKEKEVLTLDKEQEVSSNTNLSKEDSIPLDTEKLIQQAENYLRPVNKKWYNSIFLVKDVS